MSKKRLIIDDLSIRKMKSLEDPKLIKEMELKFGTDTLVTVGTPICKLSKSTFGLKVNNLSDAILAYAQQIGCDNESILSFQGKDVTVSKEVIRTIKAICVYQTQCDYEVARYITYALGDLINVYFPNSFMKYDHIISKDSDDSNKEFYEYVRSEINTVISKLTKV